MVSLSSVLELLRDLFERLPAEEPDLISPQGRIVPDLHAESELLLEPTQPVGVLLHQMHRHVRMDAEDELLLTRALADSPEHPLDLERRRREREHPPRALARRAVLGKVVREARTLPLTGHLDQPKLADREGLGPRPVVLQVTTQRVRDRLPV